MRKKIFAMLMAAALCVGMLPSSVLAATVDEGAEPISEEVGSGEFGDLGSLEIVGEESATTGDESTDLYEEPDVSGYEDGTEAGSEDLGETGYEEGYDLEGSGSGEDGYYEEIIPNGTDPDVSEAIDDAESGEAEIDEEAEDEESEEDIESEEDEDGIMLLAVESGDVGVSSFVVQVQVDGRSPFDGNNDAGNDSGASNDIVRSFDYVDYTLEYTTALKDASVPVDSSTLYVEFTLPCGPDTASFNMNVMNWMGEDAVTTYYMDDDTTKTTFNQDTDKGHVTKQVLTGNMDVNTPGEGTLTVGLYIGAASNGTTITPSFTAWMQDNADADKVTVEDVHTLTVSAAPKYKLQIKQATGLNLSDTYDLTAGSGGSTDQISGNTSINGRLEGYGVTIMMENDSVEKGLKGLEFPSGDITFDLTLTEVGLDSSGNPIDGSSGNDPGWTPVVWDYDENAEARVTDNSYVGEWGRTLYNYSWANDAAPANKLGQTDYNTVYDSCYDGGDWTITQTGPLTYSVTVKNYTIDYADFNFPTADLASTAVRIEPGSIYQDNQACYSAGYVQCILQYLDSSQIDENTKIDFTIKANNFAVGGVHYDVSASYNNSYQLVVTGGIDTRVWFGNPGNTGLYDYSNSNTGILGSDVYEGDAYSFQGSEVRINAGTWITSDTVGKTTMAFTKWDADCFDVKGVYNVWWSNASSYFPSGSWSNSCTIYYAGRDSNWASEQEMSDTLINNTSLTFYSSPEAVEAAGQVCVGGLLVADTYNLNGDLRIGYQSYIKDGADIGSVYAACTESWVSTKTMDELESSYGAFITDGKLNTDLVRNGYWLYKAYCSRSVYETMKNNPEQDDSYYHKSVYDDSGNIVSGNITACYGGNSILICGEQCTVEIKTDKSTYNMDSGQRTATVTVTPTVNVVGSAASGSGQGEDVTDVTVTVTLPAGLTYDSGTAYWGDQPITPEVIENDDGTTTLTFILNDVVAGSDPTDITFDCTIGHAGYADDVENNDSLSLNATIASTRDNRTKHESFGNSSSTSINIVRLTSISIGKSVNHRGIELDGEFIWTLTFYNGSGTDKSATDMADVLPADGDAMGSSFSGDYYITEVDIDFSGADKSYSEDHENMHFYVSNNYEGTGEDLAAGDTPEDWYDLIKAPGEEDDPTTEIITIPVPEEYQDMKAFYCDLGVLDAGETITINLNVKTEGNEPGDTYNNVYYESASDQEAPVESNSVTTQVVQRNISGRTWIDANENGIQDAGEQPFENVMVTLYQETDSANPTGVTPLAEQQAVDVYGNTVEPVWTGEDGSYTFENLPGGTYRIQFSYVNGYLYALTEQNVGDDDTIDSDAGLVSNYNGNLVADITDVELPPIEEMTGYVYNDNNNDAGYYSITIDIEGNKEWDDEDNQDGIRPDFIDVYLLADGEAVSDGHGNDVSAHVTPDDEGNWTFKFTELPKYNGDGTEIVYTIKEISVTGYETTVSELAEETDPDTGEGTGVYTLTITNKHESETINIQGEKVWDDASDQDGKRPGSVMINLLADGEPALYESGDAITATVTSDDDWEFSFTNLPKYKDGTEIQYNITEDAVYDYSTEITITQNENTGDYEIVVDNSYIPEQTSVNVIKVWDDEENQDGYRPESITVELLANDEETGKTLVLEESNNWQGSFTGLDVNTPVGQQIIYTIAEINVDEYETVITGDGTTGFVITNKHEPETVNISGAKIWDDANNQDGKRPSEIMIRLLADGVEVRSLTVTPDDEGKWTWSFEGLPKYSEGKEIIYTVTEDVVEDYSTDYSGYDVINSYIPEKTSLTVTKAWDDADDQDGVRPISITVELLANNESTGETLVLNADNNWTGSFTGLDKYQDGVEIAYSVAEVSVAGYESEITGNATSGYVITNKHEPELIDIEGIKTWDDNDDEDGIRPESITVYLLAGNTIVETLEVTPDASGTWSWSFTDLPKYDKGVKIAYRVIEQVNDGYSATYDEDDYDIVNKHTPDQTSVTVVKHWDDNDDQDGKRPGSITVKLLADSEDTGKTLVLDESNNWQGSFTELDVNHDHGTKIAYSVEEVEVPDGYECEVEQIGENTYAFVVTNTHEPEEVDISGIKIWDDDNDSLGYRPAYITVRLLADGEEVSYIHVTAEDDWEWSFTGLAKYKDGKEIEYTVTEDAVDDYITDMTGDAESGYEITNKVVAPKLTKEVDEDDYERKEESGDEMHPGEDTEGGGWGSWDDADNNQEVIYHLKVADLQGVANLTVHDYLEEGLDFESSTIEVSLNDGGKETALKEGADYEVSEGACSDPGCIMDGCTFEVKFINDDLFDDVSSDAYLVITYKALTDTHEEDYDDYEDDLLNYSYMTYGVNPLSIRRSAVVIAETDLFGFGIYKYADEFGEEVALAGAEFVLERDGEYATFEVETDEDTGETYYMVSGWVSGMDSATTLISAEDGMIRIEGLDDDTYTLIETKAPDGYVILDGEITVTIDEYGNLSVSGNTSNLDESGHVVDVANTIIPIPDKDVDADGDGTYEDSGMQVQVGDTLVYKIDYENPFNVASTVTITDELDVGLDYVESTDDGFYDEGNRMITWVITDVEPHTNGSVYFTALVNEIALVKNEVDNTATVQVGEYDAQQTKTVYNPVPGKDVDADGDGEYGDTGEGVQVGDTLTYEINYFNGNEDSATVTITDVLDEGLTYVSSDPEASYDGTTLTWVVTDVEAQTGGSVTFTATVNDNALVRNVVENTATVQIGDDPDTAVETNPVYNPVPDKDVDADGDGEYKDSGMQVQIGDTLVYKIDYENPDDDPADVMITDEVDVGLDVTYISEGGSYDRETRMITWVLPDVPAHTNGSVTFTAIVNENVAVKNYVDNTAFVQVGNHAEQQTKTVYNPVPSKDVDADENHIYGDNGEEVYVGETLTYTISYFNGYDVEEEVFITDILDEGLTYVESSDGGVYDADSHTITWDIEHVEAHTGGAVTFSAIVNGSSLTKNEVDNVATVQIRNYSVQTNEVENPVPDKDVDADGDGTYGDDGMPVNVGDTLTYRIDYHNSDDDPAEVVITDVLDVGLDFVSADNGGTYDESTRTITWTIDDVEGHTTGNVTFKAVVNENALERNEVENTASVKVDGWPAVETNTVHNPVTQKDVDADGDGEYGDSGMKVSVGDELTYKIDYENPDETPATVTITDVLDEGLDFVSADNGGTYDESSRTITWVIADVEGHATGNVTFDATANDKALVNGEVDNTATVQVGDHPSQQTNTVWNPLWEPEKSVDANGDGDFEDDGVMVNVGDEITYKVTYKNYHDEVATVTITDALDENVTFISATDGGLYDAGTHTITWTLTDVEAGYAGDVQFTVLVKESALGPHEVDNTASVKVGNDSAQDTNTVWNPVPEKSVDANGDGDFSDDGMKVNVGDEVTYQIDYTNGHDEAATVTITDKLDANLEFVSATDGGTYDASTHTVTWVIENVGARNEGTVEFTGRVKDSALTVNEVDNTASIQIGNDTSVDTNRVRNPLWEPEKSVDANGDGSFTDDGVEVKVGDELVYKVTYNNYQDEAATVVITDALDPNVEFISATDGGTYDASTHTVTWTLENVAAGYESYVQFTVKVLSGAVKPGAVENTATVKVGNDDAMTTNRVVNPVTETTSVTSNPDTGNPNPTGGTKTSDVSMTYLWILLMIAAAAMVVAGVTLRTRPRVHK